MAGGPRCRNYIWIYQNIALNLRLSAASLFAAHCEGEHTALATGGGAGVGLAASAGRLARAGYTWHVAPHTRPRTWKSGQQVLSVLPTLWQWWKVLSGSQVRLIACSWS